MWNEERKCFSMIASKLQNGLLWILQPIHEIDLIRRHANGFGELQVLLMLLSFQAARAVKHACPSHSHLNLPSKKQLMSSQF